MSHVFAGVKNSGVLDYVSAWYLKAAQFIQGTDIKVAFVSTKSITQGEQVGVLWRLLLDQYHVKIQFAHQTFKWTSEAKGKAAVHCIIIGFGLNESNRPFIFEYETPEAEAYRVEVKHINPYLVDAPDVLLFNRSKPICDVPEIGIGNKPIDGGNYLFTEKEKEIFLIKEPKAAKYVRPWIGSDEFINGYRRYCLWLGDCPPEELRSMPEVMKRVEAVRQFRLQSKSKPTQKLAETPTRFHVENIPTSPYVVIPEVSSERRKYIPMGFLTPDILSSNLVKIVPNATIYHFGVLTSSMHMAWVRYVCGRLESRYRYSIGIVYNNFPWPEPSDKQRLAIEEAAKNIIEIRGQFPKSSLADLYDPLTMPPALVQGHNKLNTEVEKAYGKKFNVDANRVAFLFEKYLQMQK